MKEAPDLFLFPFVMKISRAFSYKVALLRCGGLQEKRKNKKQKRERKRKINKRIHVHEGSHRFLHLNSISRKWSARAF